ncbi:Short-chain alcohol dehydrogenase [Halanaeroarchaeum sp. HSR-CO]|nr:Short-chain alcohol dehydrogenase [Halanaeroarchaeum sp. HSR-CO]
MLLTGAGTPLADRVARGFAERGARVVLGGRDEAAVLDLAEAIEGDGGWATGLRTDARDEFDLERLAETAARFGDGIDVVVPAASVSHGDTGSEPLQSTSFSAFDDTLRTIARGAFATIREAVPHLRPDGRVVVPVVRLDERAGAGPLGVAQAARIAVMAGFAADLDQAVGAVAVDTVPETASAAELDEAADRIVWVGTTPDLPLDGAVLDGSDRE